MMSPVKMLAEEIAASMTSGKILGSARNLAIVCVTHGPLNWNQKAGHHSTLQESELKKLFPKAVRAQLKQLLSREEWQAFTEALQGRLRATNDMVANWQRRLSRL